MRDESAGRLYGPNRFTFGREARERSQLEPVDNRSHRSKWKERQTCAEYANQNQRTGEQRPFAQPPAKR